MRDESFTAVGASSRNDRGDSGHEDSDGQIRSGDGVVGGDGYAVGDEDGRGGGATVAVVPNEIRLGLGRRPTRFVQSQEWPDIPYRSGAIVVNRHSSDEQDCRDYQRNL